LVAGSTLLFRTGTHGNPKRMVERKPILMEGNLINMTAAAFTVMTRATRNSLLPKHGDRDEEGAGPTPTPVSKLQAALESAEKIREDNDVILKELLTIEEVRELYLQKIENPDLSLYDDNSNRLSEEAFIAKWASDNGLKTPEMIATMEAVAWAPLHNFLENQRRDVARKEGRLPDIDEEADHNPDSNQASLDASTAADNRRRIEQQEADIIRSELLTRVQIDALYDQKISENNPEVISADGTFIPKEVFVSQFISTYGELTPQLDADLDKYLNR